MTDYNETINITVPEGVTNVSLGINISIANGGGSGGGGGGEITYVGTTSATFTNSATPPTLDLTALTGGSDSAAQEGDLVFVYLSSARANVDQTVTMAGYTTAANGFANGATFRDTFGFAAYKRMGAVPDTSVSFTLGDTSKTNEGIVVRAMVFRGVDAGTPIDVAAITTQKLINGGETNVAAITAPAGAAIIAMGSWTQSTTPTPYAVPSGFDVFAQAGQAATIAHVQGMAYAISDGSEFAANTWVTNPPTADSTAMTSQSFILALNPA